ncbi:MAG: homoserine kinase [Gemmatimonadales bacterium]|nr:MAG: homoserine kinase [Gemmatimonadales bacterium]
MGLAIDLWLEARLVEGEGPAIYRGTLEHLDPARDLFTATFVAESPPGGTHLEVESRIPVGKGLGSSAAAIVAALALADLARGLELRQDTIFDRASRIEGHPDNAGPAVYGGLFLASSHRTQLKLNSEVGIALAIPEASIDTRQARALLPEQISREAAIGQAARAAALVLGLTGGEPELIAFGMEDHIAVPCRRKLIIGYDAAVRAGLEAGAWGVTISGAGSALLAFAPKAAAAEVAGAMAQALTRAGNPARDLAPEPSDRGLTIL